ncbi:MAG: ABC transporter permease [Gammaproteobacteria bacterium]|nr:ABC transporter permease [Gammaproteobacteria bacterium]QOJ32826.1 MAG: ABC transporter permease [Gammaproteobacteria bacterium]
MTAANSSLPAAGPPRASLWRSALYKLRRDRAGLFGLAVVLVYLLAAVGAWSGWWASDWALITGTKWGPVSAQHWFGTNIIGQDIFQRAIYSTGTAFQVGLVVALLAVTLGALLGAAGGFFAATWIDEVVLWLMGVLDAMPFYLMVAAIAFAMADNPYAMHVAMVSTFWTTTGRLVRGEVIKLRELEFVEAARAIGVPPATIIFRHILPNTFHILLVQLTLCFVDAIKAEVVLSFLGLGVKDGMSWGLMISESTLEFLAGHFNNLIVASALLFGLVFAFNMLADSLQDALDPKQVA